MLPNHCVVVAVIAPVLVLLIRHTTMMSSGRRSSFRLGGIAGVDTQIPRLVARLNSRWRTCQQLSDSRNPPMKWQCDPNGIRTRVTAVKGRCPGPLDDRVVKVGN